MISITTEKRRRPASWKEVSTRACYSSFNASYVDVARQVVHVIQLYTEEEGGQTLTCRTNLHRKVSTHYVLVYATEQANSSQLQFAICFACAKISIASRKQCSVVHDPLRCQGSFSRAFQVRIDRSVINKQQQLLSLLRVVVALLLFGIAGTSLFSCRTSLGASITLRRYF